VLTPGQVQEIVARGEKQDPGIVDRLGSFYGRHPDLVKGWAAWLWLSFPGKMAD
jgi:hypothetical protein